MSNQVHISKHRFNNDAVNGYSIISTVLPPQTHESRAQG